MKNLSLLFVAGALGVGALVYAKSQDQPIGGALGGSGWLPSSQDGNTSFNFSDLFGGSSIADSGDLALESKKSASAAEINRSLAIQSGATGGYSSPLGFEVFTKGNEVIGGSDLINNQSLSPAGVAEALSSGSSKKKKKSTSGGSSSGGSSLNYTPAPSPSSNSSSLNYTPAPAASTKKELNYSPANFTPL